jgi:hypothetical protein
MMILQGVQRRNSSDIPEDQLYLIQLGPFLFTFFPVYDIGSSLIHHPHQCHLQSQPSILSNVTNIGTTQLLPTEDTRRVISHS